MAEYRLHCFAQSGNSYKAALMLGLTGADWEPVFVDFFNGTNRLPEFLALNPMGEAPVLEHDGLVLTQSGVILDYLASKLGRFGPRDEAERCEILRWTLWDNHKLTYYNATWRFMINFVPEEKRQPEVIAFLQTRSTAALEGCPGSVFQVRRMERIRSPRQPRQIPNGQRKPSRMANDREPSLAMDFRPTARGNTQRFRTRRSGTKPSRIARFSRYSTAGG